MMKLDTDRIVGVTALLVGLGSLFVVIYQTRLARETARAAALPYLNIVLTSNDKGVYLNLGNVGVGPALIDDVRISYQGREIQADPYEFYTGLHKGDENRGLSVDKVQKGRLIPAGYNIQMLGTTRAEPLQADRMLKEVLRLFEIAEVPRAWYADVGVAGTGKAVIEVTYSSVYGERWRLRSDRIVPEHP